MAAPARGERLQIMLADEELAALDDWRFDKRMPSRAAFRAKIILKRKPTAAGGRNTADSTNDPRMCRRRLAGYPVGISPAESILPSAGTDSTA